MANLKGVIVVISILILIILTGAFLINESIINLQDIKILEGEDILQDINFNNAIIEEVDLSQINGDLGLYLSPQDPVKTIDERWFCEESGGTRDFRPNKYYTLQTKTFSFDVPDYDENKIYGMALEFDYIPSNKWNVQYPQEALDNINFGGNSYPYKSEILKEYDESVILFAFNTDCTKTIKGKYESEFNSPRLCSEHDVFVDLVFESSECIVSETNSIGIMDNTSGKARFLINNLPEGTNQITLYRPQKLGFDISTIDNKQNTYGNGQFDLDNAKLILYLSESSVSQNNGGVGGEEGDMSNPNTIFPSEISNGFFKRNILLISLISGIIFILITGVIISNGKKNKKK